MIIEEVRHVLYSYFSVACVQAQGKNSGPASKARYFVKRPFS
jgi:hypothetical protein